MVRAPTQPEPDDIEHRLFEFSLGPLRLLDTVLDQAGQGKRASLLRDLLMDWRAYPSRTIYSRRDLLGFVATLGGIQAGLRKAREGSAAEHVARIIREIETWMRPRSR